MSDVFSDFSVVATVAKRTPEAAFFASLQNQRKLLAEAIAAGNDTSAEAVFKQSMIAPWFFRSGNAWYCKPAYYNTALFRDAATNKGVSRKLDSLDEGNAVLDRLEAALQNPNSVVVRNINAIAAKRKAA